MTNSFRTHFSALLFILTACLVHAQDAAPSFSITISMPSEIKAGSQPELKIRLTNTCDHVIPFDRSVAGLGERNFDIVLLDTKGNPAPSTACMKAIRGEDQGPGPKVVLTDNYFNMDLKPGESVTETTYLGRVFELKPGTYRVQVSRRDFGPRAVVTFKPHSPEESDLNKPLPKGLSKPNPTIPVPKPRAIAKSNVISFTVVP